MKKQNIRTEPYYIEVPNPPALLGVDKLGRLVIKFWMPSS